MIIGIGTDIVDVERIINACNKERFLNRCYTSDEIKYFEKHKRSVAGNFAVKEAVSKMLGTGFVKFGPKDIEVLRDKSGKPYVNLYNMAKKICNELNINSIHVSISDTRDLAIAYVIGERI